MDENVLCDIEDFISRARERQPEREEDPYDETTYGNYQKFSNLEEHKDYYQEIKVCKAILSDIKSQTFFLLKMEKYSQGISHLSGEDVDRIRYNAEDEAYIVYANGSQYEIFEDDIRFIYPSIVDIPDSHEYEVVIENSSVYVYNKFTADPPFRVFGVAESAGE